MITGRLLTVRLFGLGVVGGLLVVWCSLGGCCSLEQGTAAPKSVVAEREGDNSGGAGEVLVTPVNLESEPLPRIPAGTVIGTAAPKGWSHFIMIAIPTLTKEDLRDAPKIATHYARMFKFTLLAQSEKVKDVYRFKGVARGFAMTIRDKEVIVDPKNTFGADLGAFGRRILDENEQHIDKDLRTVARTPNLFLFDAQAMMRQGTDHVRMVLRHAVVLDPATDKVSTFVWLLARESDRYAIAEKEFRLIPEGFREERFLSVKRDRFTFGIPSADAFALMRTPQGAAIRWTTDLANLAGTKDLSKDQVIKLEKQLLAIGQTAAKK